MRAWERKTPGSFSPNDLTVYSYAGQPRSTTFPSQNTRREAIIFTQQSHEVVEGSMTAMRRQGSSESGE